MWVLMLLVISTKQRNERVFSQILQFLIVIHRHKCNCVFPHGEELVDRPVI